MKLIPYLLYFAFTISPSLLIAQTESKADTLSISAQLLDQNNREALPYVTVYNKNTARGTVTNLDGHFTLKHLTLGDTLLFSYVGYKRKQLIVKKSLVDTTIRMQSNTQVLSEFTIFADDSYLYDLVAGCKKAQTIPPLEAKTYYVLESEVNAKQVELVECYYNGKFTGYDVDELALKQGRLALDRQGNRFFISTESSRAFYLHKAFGKNAYFPISPLQLNKKQLKRKFNLSLASVYLAEDSTKVSIIDFAPTDTLGGYFEGRLWIDGVNRRLIKLEFNQQNATIHPFLPGGYAETITQVNLNISKTFQLINDFPYVNSIDFDYVVSYETTDSIPLQAKTNVVLYAYDYSDRFALPRFQFSEGRHEDYRNINAIPYNTFFWNQIKEFEIEEVRAKNELFITNHSEVTNQDLFASGSLFEKGFLEHPYIFWKEDRVVFRPASVDTIDYSKYAGIPPAKRYNLEAQIYLDVTTLNDSTQVITKTILDPYKTFYYFQITPAGAAFINMYFDLVEVYRRQLQNQIDALPDKKGVYALYAENQKQLEQATRSFFKEVERGTNPRAMMKWNRFIKEEIDVDNLLIFQLAY